jgi:hypothetical protein
MEDFGFIMLRNINTSIHNEYWKECVRCIRNYYNEKIIIIDDNSKIKNDIKKDEILFDNISIVFSEPELKGVGEFLGYYYAWKYKPFKQFVIIHDSMFMKEKLPSINDNVKFLWHFDKHLRLINFQNMINKINQSRDLLDLYKTNSWIGCFGVASIIKLEFLNLLFEKYNLNDLIYKIKSRLDRESMERIFALMCILNDSKLNNNPSIYGNILENYPWGLKWEEYKNTELPYKMIKIFSAR